MTDHPNRPPLWQVMDDAYDDHLAHNLKDGYHWPETRAAEIRALRDYIRMHVPGHGWHPWQVRQIADLLTAEADRAERGK